MQFEAESNGIKYEVSVLEGRKAWRVSLKPEGEDWRHYEIPKTDYQFVDQTISFIFKDTSYLVDAIGEGTNYDIYTRGTHRTVEIYNEENLLHESLKGKAGFGGGLNLNSGMPGKIVKVMVEPGQAVAADEPLLIMEAMKMENEMRASAEAIVETVHVQAGDNVEAGATLISFKKAESKK